MTWCLVCCARLFDVIERMQYCKILQACFWRDLFKHSELFTRLPGAIVSEDINLPGSYCFWCITWRHAWLDLMKSIVHTSARRTIDWQSKGQDFYIRLESATSSADSLTLTIKESLLFYSMQGKSSKPRVWSGVWTRVRAVGQQSCTWSRHLWTTELPWGCRFKCWLCCFLIPYIFHLSWFISY